MISIENIIVWLIVAIAAFFTLRSLYRIFTGKSKGCGSCGSSCKSCDSTPSPQQDIPPINDDNPAVDKTNLNHD